MSGIVTAGEVAAAAGDAYGAYQGGLSTPANQASFGAAVAAGAAAMASTGSFGAFAQGLGIGVAPATAVTQTVMNLNALQNAQSPGDALAASLGILGGAAGTIAGLMPPSPQKVALTGIAIAASAAQQLVQNGQPLQQSLIDLLNKAANEFLNLFLPEGMRPRDRGYSNFFDSAKNWVWPRDPILLDLDGNGLETVGLASNVYFDHDGDGILTRTGWVGQGDALLVWDRNGNGTIDTGAELFGDFTVLPNGTLAPNGFAALAALDANGDGVIDATDPAFAELKLWRDISQDGVSQGGELVSLADAGIVSLNLAHSLKNQRLANGNTLAREGTFTRADGSTSAMGEFKLAIDTFDTRFAEEIEVPEALRVLPNMQGAGNVRELQQAAAQSSSLAGVLAQFQNAGTRAEQKALLDQLITAWADTSGMAKSLEERASGKYRIVYEAFGNERRSSSIDTVAFAAVSSGSVGGSGGGAALMTDFGGMYLSERYRNLISEWSRKLHVLEAFNGQYFFNLPEKKSQTDGANWGLAISAGSGGGGSSGGAAMAIEAFPTLRVNFSQAQLDLLQQAYDSLKESVYASLVMQTRLKPYLNQIELVIDEQGLRLDATQLNQMLAAKKAADPENYLADLLDLDRYANGFLSGTNWVGLADFDTLIETLPQTAGITALLDEFKVKRL
ncbi:MAG: hypothetical protein PHO57_12650, partial [Acidithiobacillus sp.]|nr:hypothetical protein [Acidithiobacillus sp.]